ncbi:conjugal transfer protein TraO [Chryseobacterium sp.]|uniref:conjugal transfer protein TraO n=1 Tax=Chryseobacterium sp. TaxID=1871047 RepID=UPI0028A02093|nr:conjugal transfer protein TraO [Chryseobacterium sp.]
MRGLICIIVLMLSNSIVKAQRMIPNQNGIELSSGNLLKKHHENYFVNLGLVVYAKKGNYFLYSVEFSKNMTDYKTFKIPIENYLGEIGYSLNLISNRTKSIMINSTISVVGGYENINRDRTDLPDGAILKNDSNYIYGASGRLSVELYLSDRFVLLGYGKARMLWNTSLENLRPSIGFGLRINL